MSVLTKKELIDIYAEKKGLKKNETGALLDEVFETLQEIVVEYGAGFRMGDLGTFKVVLKPERTFRNPQNGETGVKPAHYAVKFATNKNTKETLEALEVE